MNNSSSDLDWLNKYEEKCGKQYDIFQIFGNESINEERVEKIINYLYDDYFNDVIKCLSCIKINGKDKTKKEILNLTYKFFNSIDREQILNFIQSNNLFKTKYLIFKM